MKTRKHLLGLAIAAGASAMLFGASAQAAAIITGNTADAELTQQEAPGNENATGPAIVTGQNDTSLHIGLTTHPGGNNDYMFGINAIYLFQLPAAPVGGIASADLAFTFLNHDDTNEDADLYGLPYQSNTTIDPNDFYNGAYGSDPNATAIEQAILIHIKPSNSANATPENTRIHTDTTGDTNLLAYLQAQYANGAQAGDYVLFRLVYPDDNTGESRSYIVASAEDTANAPTLTIDFVPEPASLALLGLGALVMLPRRKRKGGGVKI